MRWSPARMPRPPEYCGSTAVMPNSGREVARSRAGAVAGRPALVPAVPVRYAARSARAAPSRSQEARRRRRAPRAGRRPTAPSSRTGSRPVAPTARGRPRAKTSWVSRVPGPAQVAGQVAERGERLGQDGTDGESSDGAHPQTLARCPWIDPSLPADADALRPSRRTQTCRITQPAPLVEDETRPCVDTGTRPDPLPVPRTVGSALLHRLARLETWSDASPSWTSCPWSTSAGSRPRRPSASRSRSRATVFREGHDQLGAEVVLTGPDGAAGHPVRMTKHGRRPRPLRRLGDPGRRRAPGPSRSRPGPTRSPPGSTTPGSRSRPASTSS